MSVELYAYTCGHLTIPRAFMLEGRAGPHHRADPGVLVVHPGGTALFDSGLHVDSQTDPVGYAGESSPRPHLRLPSRPGGVRPPGGDGCGPGEHQLRINSHLHFDHAGGNAQLPNADVVIQRREWDAAHRDDSDKRGYVGRDFDTGQHILQVDGEHDLFGDGSVVCIPTYGHTPGHQSLRVRTGDGSEFVLCGDACYLGSPSSVAPPRRHRRQGAALATFQRFRALHKPAPASCTATTRTSGDRAASARPPRLTPCG